MPCGEAGDPSPRSVLAQQDLTSLSSLSRSMSWPYGMARGAAGALPAEEGRELGNGLLIWVGESWLAALARNVELIFQKS